MPINSNPFKNLTILLLLFGCFILYSVPVSGQSSFDFRSETIFSIFERDTEKQSDSLIMPIYEYLQFDFGNLEGDGLSLHFNGWGWID